MILEYFFQKKENELFLKYYFIYYKFKNNYHSQNIPVTAPTCLASQINAQGQHNHETQQSKQ